MIISNAMHWKVYDQLKFTIVTISYNQSEFLERAIRSVVEQDYDNIEYIIVDPGSTDKSREIIEKYRARIDKIIFEPDESPADGLNKGFSIARGDIFGYLNADDEYLPGTFKKVSGLFSNHPSLDVICGGGYIIDNNNNILRRIYSDPFNLRRYVYGGVTILQQSTFFKRDAFISVGGFNKENRTCWDGELMLDFGLQKKKIKIVHEPWSLFRIHDASISGSGKLNKQYCMDLQRLFKKSYNRDQIWFDALIRQLIRIEKWLINPVALGFRLGSMINPKSILRKL